MVHILFSRGVGDLMVFGSDLLHRWISWLWVGSVVVHIRFRCGSDLVPVGVWCMVTWLSGGSSLIQLLGT